MAIVIVVVLLLALGLSLTGVVLTRRSRGPELEPPGEEAEGDEAVEGDGEADATATSSSTATATAEPELAEEQVAEIEAALAKGDVLEDPVVAVPEVPPPRPPKPSFRERLGKARGLFSGYLGSVRSRGKITDETWDDLEEALILADVGVETTAAVLDELRGRLKSEGITDPDGLLTALKDDLVHRLDGSRELAFEGGSLNVWLLVGVNGVGKTTTIGKLGLQAVNQGRSVIMAAGDTFRAAAADQLELWAKRVGADLVRGAEGGDPGAVVFDAKQRGAARGTDLVLADTAGRLHTKVNLMEELKKVRRVAERPPGTLSEVLLVVDATTGQNGLVQAKEFAAAVDVTGVVLTKLDGTAKGGIAVAIQTELGLPIKLAGLGEGPEDLVVFDAEEFVDAIFG